MLEYLFIYAIVSVMRKFFAYIMVFSLLVSNVASAFHTHEECSDEHFSDSAHLVDMFDDAGEENGNEPSGCDDCTCCHFHASFVYSSSDQLNSYPQIHNRLVGNRYFSLIESPPFQPPKV